ncbi:hypothetical protein [uncultured Alteromonas sp.]|uniref:hypothetical protein n=1 Tax=uncultured Alteromonas sp. TaxID=179113 RepID=UPI0030EDC665|tara:strand:+ start:106 stop:663 length:558 start_codon:yes stop_codon:yes gene_type:complete
MKKYVKEYKGYKVPEGATHFVEKSSSYMNHFCKVVDGLEYVFSVDAENPEWYEISDVWPLSVRNLFELPEAQQEWNGEGLPPVGVECEIAKVCDALCWNKGAVDFYGKEKCIITFRDGREAAFILNRVLFRPLKTQQEKDLEEFIETVSWYTEGTLLEKDDPEVLMFIKNMFDAGCAAPKVADNE